MYIMVLNDGETWTTVSGCKILYIDTDRDDEIDDDRVRQAYNDAGDQKGDEIASEFK